MSKPTVLIADDEPILLETIAYNLQKEGYNVLTADDGESALLQARHRPQLIVLDMMMPKLSGLAVCRALRKNASHLPAAPSSDAPSLDVPILMLTARGEESDRAAALAAGANDYLMKPFAMQELLARVRTLLDHT